MRQNPTDDQLGTNVFSSDAWGATNSVLNLPEEPPSDLSAYAAPLIPEGNSHGARSSRYAPSPHSSQYEPSHHVTNSEADPFTHASYDGPGSTQLKQNARFEDMPSPVRRGRLGEPIPSVAPDNIQATFGTPQDSIAGTAVDYAPAPEVQVQQLETNVAVQEPQAYEPIADPTPEVKPVVDEKVAIEVNGQVLDLEEEIPLSDFEEEFNAIQVVAAPVVEEEIDISVAPPESPSQAWAAPSLFTTSPAVSSPGINYHSGDAIFGTQYGNESDEDRLFKDPREPRETIQLDLDYVNRLVKRIVGNKILFVVFTILLAATAFLIFKPGSSEPAKTPLESSTKDPAGKTVVTAAPDAVPLITVPSANQSVEEELDGGGTIVHYDENGNAVYSQAPNQNYNGE